METYLYLLPRKLVLSRFSSSISSSSSSRPKPPPLDLSQRRVAGQADPHHSALQQQLHHHQFDGSSTIAIPALHSPRTPYGSSSTAARQKQLHRCTKHHRRQQHCKSHPIMPVLTPTPTHTTRRAGSAAACCDSTLSALQLVVGMQQA